MKILSNLTLYNCEEVSTKKICKQTFGYIKATNTFAIHKSSSSNAKITAGACSGSSNVGGISSSGLCLVGSSTPIEGTLAAANYVLSLSTSNASVFSELKGKSIIVTGTTSSFYYNNLYEGILLI